MLTTRPDKLMLALRQKGLPESLAYIVLTALQIFPRFQDRARVILESQQARGLEIEVNFLRRLRLLVPMVAPLILGSIVDVEERAMALEARAFNHPGAKTSWLELEDDARQRLLRAALLLAMLALIVWRVGRLFVP
jgi:energy-coupling factor transport system permease protein